MKNLTSSDLTAISGGDWDAITIFVTKVAELSWAAFLAAYENNDHKYFYGHYHDDDHYHHHRVWSG